MVAAIVVGLLVSGLAAGAVRVLRTWSQRRISRVRALPPLIVIPRPAGLELKVGAVTRPSPPAAPLKGGNVGEAARPQNPQIVDERIVFDAGLLADGEDAPPRAANFETVRFPRPVSPRLSAIEASYEIIRRIGRGETSVVYLGRSRATLWRGA